MATLTPMVSCPIEARNHKGYIAPAISGSPSRELMKKATNPLPSSGPQSGVQLQRLHNLCHLGVPIAARNKNATKPCNVRVRKHAEIKKATYMLLS